MGRFLLLLPLFVVLAGYDKCDKNWPVYAARDHLGSGAVCGFGEGAEVLCIRSGQRFSCMVDSEENVACAVQAVTPAEGK